MPLSTTFDVNVQSSLFGDSRASWAPAAFDLGLSSTSPGKDGSGLSEPTDASYGRASNLINSTANWPVDSSGNASNANEIPFGVVGSAGWGTVYYWVLFVHGTNTIVAYDQLTSPATIVSGATPDVPAGSLTIGAN